MVSMIGPLAFLVLASRPHVSQAGYDIRADGIVTGNARFQPLGNGLVRMEYSQTGAFVDAPTAVVCNRLKPVEAKVDESAGWLSIQTSGYRLRYKLGSGPFTAKNLQVAWPAGSWLPGQVDHRNLGSAVFSLDGVSSGNLPMLRDGVLSRSGYWLYDDSADPVIDPATNWIVPRPQPLPTDEYLFVYGDDFKAALKDYARLTGDVPLTPRYALGVWHSKDYDFKDWELKDLVNGFRSRKIPLDVLVLDGEWHKYGWEGYDFNETDFPDPAGFLRWCHEQGLRVTMNNHPGNIVAEDSHTQPARKMLGLPQANEGVSFNLANQAQAEAYNSILHDPWVDAGVDFWWIDGYSADMPGLDGQFWTNRVYYENLEKHTGNRALIYSRWGGPGNQHYPLGFSGDTTADWDTLRYETAFTPTASNALWQWSNDIGAYHGGYLPEELMARWTQFGAFSPIMRFHSAHGERRPWAYAPETEKVMTDACRWRDRLIPYAYSLEHDLWTDSLPVYRPLYLEDPKSEESYQHPYEYFFGSDLLVAPASAPTVGGVTDVPVYLPPGKWRNFFTGMPYEGGRTFLYPASLEDIPVFARAGAIIPTQADKLYDAQPSDAPLVIRVYRGASGSFTLKEDDGLSLGYKKGAVATTKFTLQDSKDGFTFAISPRQGTYQGAPAKRAISLLVYGASKPRAVTVDGSPVDWSMEAGGVLVMPLGGHPAGNAIEVKVDDPNGIARFDYHLRAESEFLRLHRIQRDQKGAVGAAFEEAIAKLRGLAAQAEAGSIPSEDIGTVLLDLASRVRPAGDLAEDVLDFRCSAELDQSAAFGLSNTLSACASWDPNLPSDAIHIGFAAPRGYEVKRVSPPDSGFGRWSVTERPEATPAEVTATFRFSADLPGGPVLAMKNLNWSNDFVTKWKLLGPFAGMTPAADELTLDPGKPIDFAKPVDGVKWTDVTRDMADWSL
ncbi:MAG TPA: TIM-barrel domain-containing protein, partial [Fimbriimonadaceae bacterium]|nr:TIM-barrel domain-containing protein [Fimbriimonadaceae bacterium]